jgi:hypothetical protein
VLKKYVIIYLLSTGILFFPLTDAYENIHFFVLRPKMEQVAVQIAKEYQHYDTKKIDIYNITLPKEYRYLSRGGSINCILFPEGIEIAFYKWPGLINDSIQYIYTTDISYEGNCQNNNSTIWDFYYILKAYSINENWMYLQTK